MRRAPEGSPPLTHNCGCALTCVALPRYYPAALLVALAKGDDLGRVGVDLREFVSALRGLPCALSEVGRVEADAPRFALPGL
eukprot:397652-Pyramimonas_sp.AAC.1